MKRIFRLKAMIAIAACLIAGLVVAHFLRARTDCAMQTDAGVTVTFADGSTKTFANNREDGESRAEYFVLGAFCREGVVALRSEGWETRDGILIDTRSKDEIPTGWVERLEWLEPRRSFAIYACDVTLHDDPTAGCLTTLYTVAASNPQSLKSVWSRREERTLNVIDWRPSDRKYAITVRSYTDTTGLTDATDLAKFEALKTFELNCGTDDCAP